MAISDVQIIEYNPANGASIPEMLVDIQGYAEDAISKAEEVAGSILDLIPPTYASSVTFLDIPGITPIGDIPKPEVPSISLGTRNLPSPPNLVVPSINDIDEPPLFTEADPSLNIPSVPDPLSISLPVKDFTINTDFEYPVTPDTTLPSIPTFLELEIPTALDITTPVFDLSFPTSNSITVPGITFSFSEDAYSSDLLTQVKNELISRISGGTGLSPVVEEAIWNRERDRESRAALLAEKTLLEDRNNSGFTRPPGSIQSALDQIIQETQSKIIDLGREIAIKQAELEQENVKTSIQQAISLEDILIRENSAIAQRAFETAKYTQDISIELFKASVSKFNSEVEAYKAFATAYSARVQAELSKVEIFKAQIDAEKLKGDINEQNIKIYVAQIEAIKSNVEIYKALISSVNERLKAETLKLETYKTDIDAYSSAIRAKAEEYSMYSEQIKGELSKVQVFDSKVRAYTSRIQAYSALNDTILKRAETELGIQGLNIKKYEADIDAFIKQVQADQLIYQAAVDLYKGETQMYVANAQVASTSAELDLKNAENIITQNKYAADIGLENAKISYESLKGSYDALIASKQAAGSIYAQIASSSLSALNVSAAISTSYGNSRSITYDATD